VRVYLAPFTQGTLDVPVWQGHASDVAARGLLETYRDGTYQFNHPPLMGLVVSWLWQASEATGTAFAAWLRLVWLTPALMRLVRGRPAIAPADGPPQG